MSKFCDLNFTVSCFWIQSSLCQKALPSEYCRELLNKVCLIQVGNQWSLRSTIFGCCCCCFCCYCNLNLFTHTHTDKHTHTLSLSLSLVSWDLNVSFFLSFLSLFSLLSFLPSGLMVFWLVLKHENSYRVTISWRVLVTYRGFFEDYVSAWWNIWVSTILLWPQDTFFMQMARP
jgi:hypothetical protein